MTGRLLPRFRTSLHFGSREKRNNLGPEIVIRTTRTLCALYGVRK